LIHGNQLKETTHDMEDIMIRQTSVCMCTFNRACMRVRACGYQTELRVLWGEIINWSRITINLCVCFPFIRLELSWFDIKILVTFKA